MDKNQFISIVITLIPQLILAIIAPLYNIFVTKYFAIHNPDPKKIKKVILNILRITVCYLFPIGSLIGLYVMNKEVNKSFVLFTAINFFTLTGSVLIDFLLPIINNIQNIQKRQTQLIDFIKDLQETQKEHLDLTSKRIGLKEKELEQKTKSE
jgi:hypothetical protein